MPPYYTSPLAPNAQLPALLLAPILTAWRPELAAHDVFRPLGTTLQPEADGRVPC